MLDAARLEKYVDALPNPLDNVIAPVNITGGIPSYEISIGQFRQKLHRDLEPTTLWGYNGSYPGPTFNVDRGQEIRVEWTNNLVDAQGRPLDHFLPYDNTLHSGGHGTAQVPEARTVTHLHGGVVPAASDGFPEHWVSPDPSAPQNGSGGPGGNSFITNYPNEQRAASLWYHDHSMGVTRLNVYAGMAGFYLVRDDEERSLDLPSGKYEVPLLFQDRSFYENGELYYPTGSDGDASVVPNFQGDANLVNGAVWPYMEVEPRKYRFRMLNGANSRFYDLRLEDSDSNSLTLYQIGSDLGLLPDRADRDQILIGPADRADVIVDFSQYMPGDQLFLRNLGPDGPFGLNGGPQADQTTTGQVMRFNIVPLVGTDESSLPDELPAIDILNPNDAVVTRRLTLDRRVDELGRVKYLLDGKPWSDPVSETVELGDVEVWEFVNQTPDAHPMHLHLGQFQILERLYRPTQTLLPIEDYDRGWEDTFIINPRESVKVITRFDQFPGTFVWHCHVLEHEDHEMMRPFEVLDRVPEPSTGVNLVIATVFGLWKLLLRPRQSSAPA
ncbi:MAG: multicopper oxidase domain-containing protein, partial [Pirellulales bacterium]|nr:multicopper oxidase domain-containing protein [Pirellulales bacterium]